MGPIIDEGQLRHVDDLVQRTVHDGGRATTGAEHEQLFYQPTVLTEISTGAPAYREEGGLRPGRPGRDVSGRRRGGAAWPPQRVRAQGSLHGGSYDRAMRVGRRLVAKAVHINDITVNDEAVAPFPAIKASGNLTAFGGPADAGEFTRWQWGTARETPNPVPLGGA